MIDEINQLKSDNLSVREPFVALQHEKEKLLLEVGRLVGAHHLLSARNTNFIC